MIKWLTISVVVFLGFMVVLLGLGYLLKENEKTTTVLKQKLDQQRYTEQQKLQRKKNIAKSILSNENMPVEFGSYEVVDDKWVNSQIKSVRTSPHKKIIAENLTCISSEQCLTVTVNFSNTSCLVAVNSIGAAKLAKAGSSDTQESSCQNDDSKEIAQCLMNLCTLSIP